jgi:hemolysin III
MTDPEIVSYLGLRHPFSALSHLLWCVVSIFIAAMLWRLCRGDRVKQASVGSFGVSMVVLYFCSFLYHAAPATRPDLVLTARKLDFSAIYLLMAGSYTPAFGVLLTGRLRVRMLWLVWGLATVGILCRWLLPLPSDNLSMGIYLAVGLTGFLPAAKLLRAVGARGVLWAFAGCVLYTIGGVCDATGRPVLVPGVIAGHEMLHILDICATLTHVYFVVRYIVPYRAAEATPYVAKNPYASLAEVSEG